MPGFSWPASVRPAGSIARAFADTIGGAYVGMFMFAQQLAARAEAQRTAERAIPATRGLIYDRKGRLLVSNVATWAVKITPSDLPYGERDDVAARLAALLGIDASEVLTTLDSAPG